MNRCREKRGRRRIRRRHCCDSSSASNSTDPPVHPWWLGFAGNTLHRHGPAAHPHTSPGLSQRRSPEVDRVERDVPPYVFPPSAEDCFRWGSAYTGTRFAAGRRENTLGESEAEKARAVAWEKEADRVGSYGSHCSVAACGSARAPAIAAPH